MSDAYKAKIVSETTGTQREAVIDASGSLQVAEQNETRGTATILALSSTTSVTLAATTTEIDITVDCIPDLYMGFAAAPAAATAPYKLKAGAAYRLSLKAGTTTLYFATAGVAFASGDYARIQEWGG